jgi:hypothetical protein
MLRYLYVYFYTNLNTKIASTKAVILFCVSFYDAVIIPDYVLSMVEWLANGNEPGRYLEGCGHGLIVVFAGMFLKKPRKTTKSSVFAMSRPGLEPTLLESKPRGLLQHQPGRSESHVFFVVVFVFAEEINICTVLRPKGPIHDISAVIFTNLSESHCSESL